MRALTLAIVLLALLFLAGCVNSGNNNVQYQQPSESPATPSSENAVKEDSTASPMEETSAPTFDSSRKIVCSVKMETPEGESRISTTYVKGDSLMVESEIESGVKAKVVVKTENGKTSTYVSKEMFVADNPDVKTSCEWVMFEDQEQYTEYGNMESEDYEQYVGKTEVIERGGYKYTYNCEYKDFPDSYLEVKGKLCSFEELLKEVYSGVVPGYG